MAKKKKKKNKNTDTEYAHNHDYCMIIPNKVDDDTVTTGQS